MVNNNPALEEFRIELTDNRSSYRNGQILSGVVTIQPKEQWQAKQIWIEIVGVGHSRIRALQAFRKRKTASLARMGSITGFLEETETYFKQKKVLWGKEACGDCPCCLNSDFSPKQLTALSLRRHRFPFSFMITGDQLPSSFENNHCYIRYSLQACIEKLNGIDHSASRVFTLLENSDVNRSEYKMPPPIFEKETYFRCYNCRSGPLRLFANIDHSGYVPGDTLNLDVTIENSTDATVDRMNASLMQCITIKAQNGYQNERRTCVSVQDEESVRPGDVKRWANKSIIIPNLTPTIRSSGVIKLDYLLEVAVAVKNKNLITATFPIVIGTPGINELEKEDSVSSVGRIAIPNSSLSQDKIDTAKSSGNVIRRNINGEQALSDRCPRILISIESTV